MARRAQLKRIINKDHSISLYYRGKLIQRLTGPYRWQDSEAYFKGFADADRKYDEWRKANPKARKIDYWLAQ